jgi:hypothetical protein
VLGISRGNHRSSPAEGKSSAERERRIWKARLSKRLGVLPVAAVTKDKIEDFRDYLDAEVRKRIAGGKDDGISGKTAMIVWTLVRTVFKESSRRLRGANWCRLSGVEHTPSPRISIFVPENFARSRGSTSTFTPVS